MCLCLLLLTGPATPTRARVISATPRNYTRKCARLRSGDILLLTPGVYTSGLRLTGLHGTARAPITVLGRGQVVLTARAGANTLELSDCSHIVIRSLTFDGKGIAVDAIKAKGSASRGVHHITITDCLITGHGAGQQIVGISTKVPAWNWIIRRNRIIGAGTGIYLGNSNGAHPFVAGLIEYNLIRDPLGYCAQIKRQNNRSTAPGMPTGPQTTIIRYNVFAKSGAGGADGARPNLLVGGFPDSGPGSSDRYQIYGNLFYNNDTEALFQGTGRLSLHDNLFVGGQRTAIRVAPHQGRRPSWVRIYHNTIYRCKQGIQLTGLADGVQPRVFGNLIAVDDPRAGAATQDLQLTVAEAAKLFRSATLRPGKLDLQPRRVRTLASPEPRRPQVADDTDHDRDFLGRTKSRFDHCGAYARKADAPHSLKLQIPRPRRARRSR